MSVEEVLQEIRLANPTFETLHPLKLDRWHRAIVGLPEHVYMQQAAYTLFQQLSKAAQALVTMLDLLGGAGLPLDPHELSQRHLGSFTWYVGAEEPLEFEATWDKKTSSWKLRAAGSATTTSVATLEQALSKSFEFADATDSEE
jgi:hypothetical protein